MKNKIYAAMHNHMTWESNDEALSLHNTKEGAEKAISDHEEATKKQFLKIHEDDNYSWADHKRNFLDWRIQEMEIKD